MKPLSLKTKIIAGAAIAIALVVGAWLIHREGVARGRADQHLEQLAEQRQAIRVKTANDLARADSLARISAASAVRSEKSVAKSDSSRKAAAAARSQSSTADSAARAAQAKVILRGDTAIVGERTQILLPEIGSMVRTTLDAGVKKDLTIALQASTIAQDSLTIKDQAGTIADQTATIAGKDAVIADHVAGEATDAETIATLEKEKRPRFGVKTGIAIGVGGTLAVVTVAVKIIRAIGHR
jgi:uncharacterized protein (DUF2147 family)